MKKRIGMLCLSFLVLLPLAFSFTASAASTTAIYPIPSQYCNRAYGTNMSWYYFDYLSDKNIYRSGLYLTDSEKTTWSAIWGDLGTDTVTRYAISTTNAGGTAGGSEFVNVAIDFSSYESYSKFFDLSSTGYVQLWFDLAVDGYDINGYSVKPDYCNVYLYGNRTTSGDEVDSSTLDYEREYVLLTGDLFLAQDAPSNSAFKNCYFGLYGRTITNSIMRSSYINKIVIKIAFTSDVYKSNLYLGEINYRRYASDGSYIDDSTTGGNSSAPDLDETTQTEADTEGDIQNSINKAVDASNEQINNRIDDLSTDIDQQFDDLKNDDMGYESLDIGEMDISLAEGENLMDWVAKYFDNVIVLVEEYGAVLTNWIDGVAVLIDGFWEAIPSMIRSVFIGAVMFIIGRKVIGR